MDNFLFIIINYQFGFTSTRFSKLQARKTFTEHFNRQKELIFKTKPFI